MVRQVTDSLDKTSAIAGNVTIKVNSVVESVEGQTTAISQVTEGINQISAVVQIRRSPCRQSPRGRPLRRRSGPGCWSGRRCSINQIPAVVQITSAATEKSAATAQELSDQSRLMNELVRRFRLD